MTRRPPRRRLVAAVAAGAAVALTAGCSLLDRSPSPTPIPSAEDDAAPAGLERFYEQDLDWSECPSGECARMTVPIDWEDPEGETFEVALLKVAATGDRQGSLVVNPGGPGGSGVEYASYADFIVSPAIRRSFDIVGFDPRGVGQSSPIECVQPGQLDELLGRDPTPDDDAERAENAEIAKDFADACEANAGPLLAHVSTQDAAKDMDVLRAALGESKLTYLGKSYGTYLGTVYAGLFPERVGRFVLDGAIAPDLTGEELALGQAKGFDTATRAWADACVEDSCGLGSTQEEVVAAMQQVLADLDEEPLPGPGGFEITEGWGSYGVAQAMYDQGMWSALNDALIQAQGGDATELGQLAFQYADRTADGSYSGNIMQAINAVNCLDRGGSSDEATKQEFLERAEREAPIWGEFLVADSDVCAQWPIEPVSEPEQITAEGADPIVVVGTTRDPATPYEWSVQLNDQLADSSLITLEGDGHTAYLRQNSCVDNAVDEFWLTGTVPEDGLTCS